MILTSIERLVPQQYYVVVVNWNKDSNVFIDNEYILFGKFIRLDFRKRRTYSFDSGLEVLVRPMRINAVFEHHGIYHSLSSANRFYRMIKPSTHELQAEIALRTLPLNQDVVRIIRNFL
jgi:hypothetical protein